MKATTPALLSYAFRPFFLLNGCFAVLAVSLWVMSLHGSVQLSLTPLWHSHEMLIGFAMAAVAGFSLTAVANWTGRPPIQGSPLAVLVSSWLLGRLAMLLYSGLPAELVFLLDMLFPILLFVLLGREIIGGRSKRNYPLVAIMFIVMVLNILYHAGVNQWLPATERLAIYLLIHSILLLVAIVAGRITPAFTGNWLRQQGETDLPVNNDRVTSLALASTVLVGLAASFFPTHIITAYLAFAAALVHGFRLSRWKAFSTLSNPLLFVLHAAYAWLPIGYFLLGCSVFGWVFSSTAALHALTMGAIGSIVLAVTTRVALGHTGRPLKAARATVVAYWLLLLAVLTRLLGPLAAGNYLLIVDLSALGWVAAFAIFTWVYWPVLTRPKTAK
jgi:uncharacterized protein involved in response to NO